MMIKVAAAAARIALMGATAVESALAANGAVVLGDIDDLSGLYADIQGTGGVEGMAKIAAEKRVVYIVIGAVGASLTNEDCTPYSVHYAIDTTALANGTATARVDLLD